MIANPLTYSVERHRDNVLNVFPPQLKWFLYIHSHFEFDASYTFQTSWDKSLGKLRSAQKSPAWNTEQVYRFMIHCGWVWKEHPRKKKGPVPVCTGSKRRCFIQIQSARALNSFNSTGTHKNVALLSCSSSSSLTNSLSLTPTGPLLPSCARLSGLWRHDWLWRRFFAPSAATTQHNSGVERCGTQQDALRHNATQHGAAELHSGTYRATWVDKTEERVVGREAAVPLEPPVGATARPLDGQNLWLHRALSGEKTGRCLFRLYNS